MLDKPKDYAVDAKDYGPEHIRLIYVAARIVLKNPIYAGLAPFDDLVQYGRVHMPRIISGYDSKRGISSWPNYAIRALVNEMKRELNYNERLAAITSMQFDNIQYLERLAEKSQGELMDTLLKRSPLSIEERQKLSTLHQALLCASDLDDQSCTEQGYMEVEDRDFANSFAKAVKNILTEFEYSVWYHVQYMGLQQYKVAQLLDRSPMRISEAFKTAQRKLQRDGRIRELYELIRD